MAMDVDSVTKHQFSKPCGDMYAFRSEVVASLRVDSEEQLKSNAPRMRGIRATNLSVWTSGRIDPPAKKLSHSQKLLP